MCPVNLLLREITTFVKFLLNIETNFTSQFELKDFVSIYSANQFALKISRYLLFNMFCEKVIGKRFYRRLKLKPVPSSLERKMHTTNLQRPYKSCLEARIFWIVVCPKYNVFEKKWSLILINSKSVWRSTNKTFIWLDMSLLRFPFFRCINEASSTNYVASPKKKKTPGKFCY